MARYCSDCTYLEKDEKKGGYKCTAKGPAAKAITKKIDTPARYGNMDACEDFEMAYARKAYDREKIYDEGKEAQNAYKEDKNFGCYAILVGLLCLIALLYSIFR